MSQPQADSLPLILFSGLGADDRVFTPQKVAFPQLVVPRWRVPNPRESLSDYCRHVADDLALTGPVIVGGISFGGIVAREFTRHVDARACLLISTVRSPRELPTRVRMAGKLRSSLHVVPFAPFQWIAARVGHSERLPISPLVKGAMRQLADADPRVVRWSVDQIFRLEEVPLDIPVRHIHGDRDPIFPLHSVDPDEVVRGGGHLLTITHPCEVNEFLRRNMESLHITPRG